MKPLTLMFDSFTSVDCISDEWRGDSVIPIYEGGLAADLSNQRPISLTCVACKSKLSALAAPNIRRTIRILGWKIHYFKFTEAINDFTTWPDSQSPMHILITPDRLTLSPVKPNRKLRAYGISWCGSETVCQGGTSESESAALSRRLKP
jgi:hypothetical protein